MSILKYKDPNTGEYKPVIGGGGGGGNVSTPDWNQNDETASDYIKNRPFYGDVTVFFPETELTFTDGAYMQTGYTGEEFAIGATYIVTWNGTEYSCVAQDVPEMFGTAIGNVGLAMGGIDTGEPFVIGTSLSQGIFVVSAMDGSTSATVKITSGTIKKLDYKYIDDVYYIFVTATEEDDNSGYPFYTSDITPAEMAQAIDCDKRIVVREKYVDNNGFKHVSDFHFADSLCVMGNCIQATFVSGTTPAKTTIMNFIADEATGGYVIKKYTST